MAERSEAAVDPRRGEPSRHGERNTEVAPEWEELLTSSLELWASMTRARWCALFLFREGTEALSLAHLWSQGNGMVPATWEVPRGGFEWEIAMAQDGAATVRRHEQWLGGLLPDTEADAHAGACVSLGLADKRFGVLELIRSSAVEPFLPSELDTLRLVARQFALYLRGMDSHRHLHQLANTDGLTGVYNYRYFQDHLEIEVERAKRYSRSLSLIMLDLNHFKQYNDLLGHRWGDDALRATAATIQGAVRRIDIVARYGGDEFAVVLPETNSTNALAAATRIAHAVRVQQVPAPAGVSVEPIGVSMGISSYPVPAESKDELIAQADEALLRTKRSRTRTIRLWEDLSPRGGATTAAGSPQ